MALNPDNKREDGLERLVVPATAQWISCGNKLPQFNEEVLIYKRDGVKVGRLLQDSVTHRFVWDYGADWCTFNEVSHWMKLPEGPWER